MATITLEAKAVVKSDLVSLLNLIIQKIENEDVVYFIAESTLGGFLEYRVDELEDLRQVMAGEKH